MSHSRYRKTNFYVTKHDYLKLLEKKICFNNMSEVINTSTKAVKITGIVWNQDLRAGNWDPETWDPGLWELRPWGSGSWDPGTLGPWNPGPSNWGSGTGNPDTQKPENWSLGLGNCYSETQNPESRTLRIELVTQISSIPTRTTDWINFNCEANFDNKKLGHLSQKLDSGAGVDGLKHLPKYFDIWLNTKKLENI